MYLLLRIVEKIFIIYFSVYFVTSMLLFFYAIIVFLRKPGNRKEEWPYENHRISIIVPAYNEQVSITTCIETLLKLDYPDIELIVVNDGSRDETMKVLLQHFPHEVIQAEQSAELRCEEILATYQVLDRPVRLVDKVNGGKADAINAGINLSTGVFICTIDADSILDAHALRESAGAFISDPATIVSGGQLAVSNDLKIVGDEVVNAKMPGSIWVQWQIIEYLKSFMISRLALSRMQALLIMSGAFSLFRKSDLLEVGGFLCKRNDHAYILENLGANKQTVCEDMEIVVRLWKHKRESQKPAKAVFLPSPICWTEVPDNATNLFKQRSRWHQGLIETIAMHRTMLLDPSYGITGLIGLPYYFFFEFLSPIMKVLALVFIALASFYGMLNLSWVLMLLLSITLTSALISSCTMVVIEHWSRSELQANRKALRYRSFGDWLQLILVSVLGEFSYSFFRIGAQLNGVYNFIRSKHEWNKFDRKGIETA